MVQVKLSRIGDQWKRLRNRPDKIYTNVMEDKFNSMRIQKLELKVNKIENGL